MSSRTAAPLAQWVPWLIGLSQPGSCPTQTPFWTSAITVQPTEQWTQTFFLTSVVTSARTGPASALRTIARGSDATAARPPAASPERSRKARRLTEPPVTAASVSARFWRSGPPALRLTSIGLPSARGG